MKYHRSMGLFFVGVSLFLLSCKASTTEGEKPIVKVNDYVITEKEFCRDLSECVRFYNKIGLTEEDRTGFLQERIRRELLIQAAVSRGLDKEDAFRQTIEKYWEQTLLTELLRRETTRLEKDIIVNRDEMEARYRDMFKSQSSLPPMESVMTKIESEIREEKKTKALEQWMTDLQGKAKIKIYEENVKALR